MYMYMYTYMYMYMYMHMHMHMHMYMYIPTAPVSRRWPPAPPTTRSAGTASSTSCRSAPTRNEGSVVKGVDLKKVLFEIPELKHSSHGDCLYLYEDCLGAPASCPTRCRRATPCRDRASWSAPTSGSARRTSAARSRRPTRPAAPRQSSSAARSCCPARPSASTPAPTTPRAART